MSKHMLIDASHPEETRVAVVDGDRIEELDFEIASKKQLRGNVYLAKVTRVEPSLQAAFIEYGGNRHGFLAFNEIHPDYFQIPAADREALLKEAAEDQAAVDKADDEDVEDELERRRARMLRKYKIQDVIRRRQVLLIQVVKEERGNKGAALTTYLSLAGRYCVLMPNTARGGGISRKITQASDRRRLKSAVASLEVPQGMGLIIRTAGAARTKAEIRRDYDYLLRLWEGIRETTLKSVAPTLIYAEEDLVKRAVRDMFDKDFESVEVEGYEGYKEARDFMRMLMPSQASKVHHYTDAPPLFSRYRVEDKISQIHSPVVPLRSGGYLVINQTEALVAIDVNSGKATRERNIEQTALKTNLEAAEEAARQLRLRDLAGLIVIDFIDMDEGKNDKAVEKVLKDALRDDRARVQMGRISQFGLMEISRQRRRMGVLEGSTVVCEHCHGAGRVRSVESGALDALRALEMEGVRRGEGRVSLSICPTVGLYILNDKREFLQRLEETHGLRVAVMLDNAMPSGEHEIERLSVGDPGFARGPVARLQAAPAIAHLPEPEADEADEADDAALASGEEDESGEGASAERGGEARRGRGRRRRRGGRGREEAEREFIPARGDALADGAGLAEEVEGEDDEEGEDEAEGFAQGEGDARGEGGRRRRRRGRRGGRRTREEEGEAPGEEVYAWCDPLAAAAPAEADPYAWRDASGRRGRSDARASTPAAGSTLATGGSAPAPGPQEPASPGADPYGWEPADTSAAEAAAMPLGALPAPGSAETAEDGGERRGRRPRRRRGGGGAGPAEPVAQAREAEPAASVEAEPELFAPEPEPEPVATEPQPVAADPEPTPEPAVEAAEREPDPSEITSPPAQPRRGWWSRLSGR